MVNRTFKCLLSKLRKLKYHPQRHLVTKTIPKLKQTKDPSKLSYTVSESYLKIRSIFKIRLILSADLISQMIASRESENVFQSCFFAKKKQKDYRNLYYYYYYYYYE